MLLSGLGEDADTEVASPVVERASNITADDGNEFKGAELVKRLMTKLKDLNQFLEELIDEFDDHDHSSVIDEGFNDPIVVEPRKLIDPASTLPESEGSESESEANRKRKKPPGGRPKPRPTQKTTQRPTEATSESISEVVSDAISDVIDEVISEDNTEAPSDYDSEGDETEANRVRRPTRRPPTRPTRRPPMVPPNHPTMG